MRSKLVKEVYSLEVKERDGIVLERQGFTEGLLSAKADQALPGAEIIRISNSEYHFVVPYIRATRHEGPTKIEEVFAAALDQAYDKMAGVTSCSTGA